MSAYSTDRFDPPSYFSEEIMIQRKRRLLSAAVLWLIKTVIRFRRHSAGTVHKPEPTPEENPALVKLGRIVTSILERALAQGHTVVPLNDLSQFILSRNKSYSESELSVGLKQLSEQGHLTIRGAMVSLPHVAKAEETVAHRIRHIGRRARKISPRRLGKWIDAEGGQLSKEQREALGILTTSPVTILTGPPGTGKTSMIRAISAIFEQSRHRVYLTAPTGRAAARLSEATGKPAQTLHRLLHGHQGQEPLKDLLTPSVKEVVIVDEASMLDLFLAERLVDFCSSRTRLIFVGDIHQLPSVKPGQILGDFIKSKQFPVITLTQTFRQAKDSLIATAAREIKVGVIPELPSPGSAKSDCYLIEADSTSEIQRIVVNAATKSLPKRCGANPLDIQILTPMRIGALGTITLNKLVRNSLGHHNVTEHSSKQEQQSDFCPNDRVLQTENDYDLGIFNGECGIVEKVTSETLTVRFGVRRIEYPQDRAEKLSHGFAITIHKSQGSEYPYVIIPIHESQSRMLTRELLYTALTRGKTMVVLVGSHRALMQAINATGSNRRTGIKDLLSPPETAEEAERKAKEQRWMAGEKPEWR
jgi:exodeoxyribonuclease V alpha subunit